MKTLGIDYGLRRIGLALTDINCTIASPLKTIPNRGDKKNVIEIADIIRAHRVERIVLGLPRYPDGNDSPFTHAVRDFGTMLYEKTGIWVVYFDEGYTSRMAEEHIKVNLGIRDPKKIRDLVDKVAASMILSEYITSEGKNGK